MPNTTATYDPAKVERLKHLLSSLQEKGKAKFYEIFVDNLKVVEKTEDAAEFETYMDYLDNDTQEVKVVIYNSGNSPRNDQYTFELKSKEKKKETEKQAMPALPAALSGLEIENRIDEKLQTERRKWEMELLKKENEELKIKIQDAEEFMDQLQHAYEEEKAKKQKLGNVDLGDLASVAFEGLIRRNTHLISKIPGGEALAGIIEDDNKAKMNAIAAPLEETKVSFKKAEGQSPIINKEDEERLQILKMMQQHFNEEELKAVWGILQKLSLDKTLISPVLDLLEPQIKEQNNNQSKSTGDEEV